MSGARGLLAESADAFESLSASAREDRIRLNLERKDPLFSPIARGCAFLRRLERPLSRIAEEGSADSRTVSRLERAADLFRSASGAGISRALDEASSTIVRRTELQGILEAVSAEKGLDPCPELEWQGPEVAIRVDRSDWETIWRNLFGNALDAAGRNVRLGIFTQLRRDAVTAAPVARIILADDAARPLAPEMIRGRGADRGWGIVADLLRRSDGSADMGSAPSAGYAKGVVLEVPAVEPEPPA
jgi:signal transduction histidine kinase